MILQDVSETCLEKVEMQIKFVPTSKAKTLTEI